MTGLLFLLATCLTAGDEPEVVPRPEVVPLRKVQTDLARFLRRAAATQPRNATAAQERVWREQFAEDLREMLDGYRVRWRNRITDVKWSQQGIVGRYRNRTAPSEALIFRESELPAGLRSRSSPVRFDHASFVYGSGAAPIRVRASQADAVTIAKGEWLEFEGTIRCGVDPFAVADRQTQLLYTVISTALPRRAARLQVWAEDCVVRVDGQEWPSPAAN